MEREKKDWFGKAEQIWDLQYCSTRQVTFSGSDMIFTRFTPVLAERSGLGSSLRGTCVLCGRGS